ncbi:CMGC family protein kinase [Trichomonas vaginalis G3]|uniref:CMGC family protein kinase n=1 Tax=Trichomonas vaginalis (strain ATCC PRA-98 / G3) TaxID=412133 RepID=A2GJR8_TRIV3|nr:STKc MAK like domain-containing protein [Trichomonas vaginalis G3]EAX82599.1 CMGC family protein kinase [Trichomonas vaginalis G3]KAI5494324.1 STKc MAK like domain-containing protein [Trichomonas vaginalis G3]|eukprot:XP_001295529.1 CMGC family protein kinase [Trichomonas vaginalis G3]
MKNFEEIQVLGDGAFGVVTKCRDKETGEIVAIKKMKQKFVKDFNECLQLKEVKSLRKIKHENVVRLLQLFRDNEYFYMVFECCGESLLKTMSKRTTRFSESEIRYIMHQFVTGLAYVHKQGFFHRDIKPDNLLWCGKTLKIADFGLAREIRSRPPYTEYISTRWYRAPEIILRHKSYNSPVDIWASACIMAELYMGKPLFQGTSETDQMYKICQIMGNPSVQQWPDCEKLILRLGFRLPQATAVPLKTLMPEASDEAIDLMYKMLMYDPSKRPSAQQVLAHPFFNGPMDCPVSEEPSQPVEEPKPQVEQQKNIQLIRTQPEFKTDSFLDEPKRNTFEAKYNLPIFNAPLPKPAATPSRLNGILNKTDLPHRHNGKMNPLTNNLFMARPMQGIIPSRPIPDGSKSAKPEFNFEDDDDFDIDEFLENDY